MTAQRVPSVDSHVSLWPWVFGDTFPNSGKFKSWENRWAEEVQCEECWWQCLGGAALFSNPFFLPGAAGGVFRGEVSQDVLGQSCSLGASTQHSYPAAAAGVFVQGLGGETASKHQQHPPHLTLHCTGLPLLQEHG